ncbi:hypothetical protein J5289_28220 (plasmid) [Rhizobium sp. B230/85]|uniref:hypothetical protein n=1 Tax=unclassified Rhizobium TaxID=2613769 RepID=UPI001AD9BDA3|nr:MULTISPECIES: hypothetical protein [unclassified Rhizobium]MBO9136522.1 hypothetical protein [Rhizobium sp. B209b/85]QXZ99718.1 hypothetical protein J5289_28220 [Rhizobium sp. B230/85]
MKTDVLFIGARLYGLRAALEAAIRGHFFGQHASDTTIAGVSILGRQSASVNISTPTASIYAAVTVVAELKHFKVMTVWSGMEAVMPDHLAGIGFSHKVKGPNDVSAVSGATFQLVSFVGHILADLMSDSQTNHNLDAFLASRVSKERIAA